MSNSRSAVAALLLTLAMPLTASDDDNGPDLIGLMDDLQRHSHKAYLSLKASNAALLGFYTHELEESIEALDAVDSYGGYPVRQMARSMLRPAFQSFENAVKAGDMAQAGKRFEQLLDACNACHVATEHGYIVMAPNPSNPYLQRFDVNR